MFIPSTPQELEKLGWKKLDVILVSGDAYIDSPYDGTALIGKVLLNAGYKVGIIAQPDISNGGDITRLGEPALFWGVSAGCVDSMVANYTASLKKRRQDDFTPGGVNNRRPDRAVIAYSNLIRRFFKSTVPIALGGLEASLRRIAHFDYWSGGVRRPVLFDAKADILIYGMGERAVLELAGCLRRKEDYTKIRGLCAIARGEDIASLNDYIRLPDFEEVRTDKEKFMKMFKIFYDNNDAQNAKGLIQEVNRRFLVQNPPALPLSSGELDGVYNLPFERDVHTYYKKQGEVRALETIRFSITTHRGCFGECRFCSIAVHQGSTVVSRSGGSVLKEAEEMIRHPAFRGIISDLGGPTANMYGMECGKNEKGSFCAGKHCLEPDACKSLIITHKRQIDLLRKLGKLKTAKGKPVRVFVSSGVRFDLVLQDRDYGSEYLRELAGGHISGQLKTAPEHSEKIVLQRMGKASSRHLTEFKKQFDQVNRELGKKQFLTYYFIAAHPGCTTEDMNGLKKYISRELHLQPEQVQVFTPTPSSYSTLMYYTEKDPFTGEKLFVEKNLKKKEEQKEIITGAEKKLKK